MKDATCCLSFHSSLPIVHSYPSSLPPRSPRKGNHARQCLPRRSTKRSPFLDFTLPRTERYDGISNHQQKHQSRLHSLHSDIRSTHPRQRRSHPQWLHHRPRQSNPSKSAALMTSSQITAALLPTLAHPRQKSSSRGLWDCHVPRHRHARPSPAAPSSPAQQNMALTGTPSSSKDAPAPARRGFSPASARWRDTRDPQLASANRGREKRAVRPYHLKLANSHHQSPQAGHAASPIRCAQVPGFEERL